MTTTPAQPKLSKNQKTILAVLANTAEGMLPIQFLHAPLFGVRFPEETGLWGTRHLSLSGTQRKSLVEALRARFFAGLRHWTGWTYLTFDERRRVDRRAWPRFENDLRNAGLLRPKRAPLSASCRASLANSLSRLENRSLLFRQESWTCRITPKGKVVGRRLPFDRDWLCTLPKGIAEYWFDGIQEGWEREVDTLWQLRNVPVVGDRRWYA